MLKVYLSLLVNFTLTLMNTYNRYILLVIGLALYHANAVLVVPPDADVPVIHDTKVFLRVAEGLLAKLDRQHRLLDVTWSRVVAHYYLNRRRDIFSSN